MSTYDGSVKIKTIFDTSEFNKGTNTINKGLNSLKSTLSSLGGIIAVAFSTSAIINFSKEASDLTMTSEASIQRLIDIYGEASEKVGDFIDSNARAIGMSKASAAQFASVYGNLFSVWADVATNAELTNQYLNMTAVVASKTGRTVSDVQERIRSGLLGNTEAIEDLGVFVNIKTIEMTNAFKRMANGKSWEQLDAYSQQQIRTMAILEQATDRYGLEVANTAILTRAKWKAAYEDFKQTWGQVVNTVLLPILRIGTMVLDVLTRGLQVIAKLSGKTVEDTDAHSNSISSAVKNQNALTDAVKKTEKAVKGTLAGFDEVNTLSEDSAKNSSNIPSNGGLNLGLEGYLGSSFNGSSVADEVNSTLATIMGVVGISLAAIGVILLFTGHIGWGIGFIIAGAALLAVSMASASQSSVAEDVIGKLATIMGVVGGAMVAIGIILIVLGSTAIGIGFIIAGAASIIGAIAALAGFDVATIRNTLSLITGIAGGAMLALGIMLCIFSGPSPLSIGLIIAGAASLTAAVTLNSEAMINAIKGFFQENAGIITGVSLALLVLGIILLVTGVGTPIGLGLIIAGCAGLAGTVASNWDFITDKIKGVWEKIKAYWNQHIAPVFTKEWWLNLAKKIGNGFISGIEGMINSVISMFEKMINWVVDGLNKISFDVPDWVPAIGGKKFGFNLSRINFDRVSVPRLAQGGVIPPNREFFAVLGDQKHGTNIEAPLDTIKQAVAEVVAQFKSNSEEFKGTIVVPVSVNGHEILRVVREAESELGKQTVYGGFANAY